VVVQTLRPVRRARIGRLTSALCREMSSGPGERGRDYAENPDRVSCFSAASFPTLKGRRQVAALISGRASRFRSAGYRGGTRRSPLAGSRRTAGPRGRAETLEGNCRRRREVGTLPDDRGLESNITQTFPQYDHLFKRPHFVRSIRMIRTNTFGSWTITCTPFTNSRMTMKELVQTLGTPTVKGADGTHFNGRLFWCGRPTALCTCR